MGTRSILLPGFVAVRDALCCCLRPLCAGGSRPAARAVHQRRVDANLTSCMACTGSSMCLRVARGACSGPVNNNSLPRPPNSSALVCRDHGLPPHLLPLWDGGASRPRPILPHIPGDVRLPHPLRDAGVADRLPLPHHEVRGVDQGGSPDGVHQGGQAGEEGLLVLDGREDGSPAPPPPPLVPAATSSRPAVCHGRRASSTSRGPRWS